MNIDFSGVSLPFNANEVLSAGADLFGVVGGFVLLALAFLVVPKIVSIIRSSFRERGIERDENGNRVHFKSAAAKAHFENFKKEKGW